MDITYRLSTDQEAAEIPDEAEALMREFRPLLQPERLLAAADILDRRTSIPDVGGIYAWWFNAPIRDVPLEGTLHHQSHHLLYVGIAPRQPSAAGNVSRSTLHKRITRNHLGGRIGSSTLRRSLAHLMKGSLGLGIARRGKKDVMPRDQEADLTRWMSAHASLSFMPHNAAWEIEERLIRCPHLALPLNIRGSRHAFSSGLQKIRSQTFVALGLPST